ncbi:MAG TPA: hypothetical protein VEC12_14070, partial [Bacteroidia bacterium]|nr:hypothetical protein [Bacteroidia bacterium]
MRKPILLFLFVCAFQALLFSQALTGVKTIPGDYANLTAAFTALNSNGVGSGGVTFNVAAGSVFNERPPVLTVKGTAANPVVFQKSGSGNNPKVVPNSAGTLTPGTYYSHGDAIIRLSGARYVTFDGIDLEENTAYTTATEFSETGYNILKENATSGCKYITIKNCRIKLSSSLLTGTAILIADRNAAGSAVAASNKQGTFNNLKFYGITSDSICSGIMKYQSQSVFYDSLADDSLDIGVEGGNIFYAIGATVMNSTAFGVNVVSEWQKTVRIHNNTIIGRKNDWTGDTWGIMVSDMPGAKVSIQNNTIRDMRAYYSLRGISNAGGNNTGSSSNHVLIKNNSVRNCVYGPLGSGALIQSSSSAPFTIIQNNLIDSVTGNAAGNGIYCSTSPDSLLITGNTISN